MADGALRAEFCTDNPSLVNGPIIVAGALGGGAERKILWPMLPPICGL